MSKLSWAFAVLMAAGICRAAAPVSVVFIIDNSGSMTENDPDEARFRIVSTLLDTLSVQSPASEAGLVIFTRRLQFDERENAFFRPAFPGDSSQHDAYVPLTKLNKAFPDGKTGSDTLKAFLAYTGHGDLIYGTKLPSGRVNNAMGPVNLRDGTDITLGFQGAKTAMAEAGNAKQDQVFIFLSDGEPTSVDAVRMSMMSDYEQGVGVPKTLAIFFNPRSATPAAPASIVSMVNNIKANGYSSANPSSALWPVNLPSSALMSALMEGLLGAGTALRPYPARNPGGRFARRIFPGTDSPKEGAYGVYSLRGRWMGSASFPDSKSGPRDQDGHGLLILRPR